MEICVQKCKKRKLLVVLCNCQRNEGGALEELLYLGIL